jgi:hypothetical protein
MAEEIILETWESDEAQDWESDEAFAESDESAEDLGEAARRRPRRKSRDLPARARGVSGMTLPGPGGPRKYSFPTKLATTAETNRGLATQELARRSLEERLDRFEARQRVQQKSDVSATGLVTLVIGGGLTVLGAVNAAKAPENKAQGLTFNDWASQGATQIATLVSATQLVTTGAKLAMSGHYSRSAFGIAGDAFAVAQLAAFAFGSLSTTQLGRSPPRVLQNEEALRDQLNTLKPNDVIVTGDEHQTWEILADSNNKNVYRQIVPE